MTRQRTRSGIDLAVEVVGSERALAQLLDISQQAVNSWRRRIPAERVLQVERVTGVPREKLRPDLYR